MREKNSKKWNFSRRATSKSNFAGNFQKTLDFVRTDSHWGSPFYAAIMHPFLATSHKHAHSNDNNTRRKKARNTRSPLNNDNFNAPDTDVRETVTNVNRYEKSMSVASQFILDTASRQSSPAGISENHTTKCVPPSVMNVTIATDNLTPTEP